MKRQHNFIDLFSGAGGFSLGFKGAGFNCVGAFDNWGPAIKTHKKNFKNTNIYTKSIEDYSNSEIKDIFSKTVPAKLQAYMSAKKPIIGIISGEGKRIIEESKCGFAIPSGKPEILISKILKLKDFDKKRREKLGKNGFEYYGNNFEYQNRINQLKKIIN